MTKTAEQIDLAPWEEEALQRAWQRIGKASDGGSGDSPMGPGGEWDESKHPRADDGNPKGSGAVAEPASPSAAKPSTFPGGCLPLPDLRQESDFDCGPTALRIVVSYFGLHTTDAWEKVFERLLRTSPTDGTPPSHLIQVAEELGLEVAARSMTVEDLEREAAAGRPVVAIVQYKGDGWDEGHYQVVAGVRDGSVYVQDPVDGPKRIGRRLFERRWHDEAAGPDGEPQKYVNYGLVFSKADGEPAVESAAAAE